MCIHTIIHPSIHTNVPKYNAWIHTKHHLHYLALNWIYITVTFAFTFTSAGMFSCHTCIITYIMHVCIHAYMEKNMHVHMHTCLYTYVPMYLHSYIPTYLHAYRPAYLPIYIHNYLHTYRLHTYIPNCIYTYRHACIPTYRHTYIPTYPYIPLHTRTCRYIMSTWPNISSTYKPTYQHTNIPIYLSAVLTYIHKLFKYTHN